MGVKVLFHPSCELRKVVGMGVNGTFEGANVDFKIVAGVDDRVGDRVGEIARSLPDAAMTSGRA